MESKKYFFAVDLGATSGRTIIGNIDGKKFELEEITRFPNNLSNKVVIIIGTYTLFTLRSFADLRKWRNVV